MENRNKSWSRRRREKRTLACLPEEEGQSLVQKEISSHGSSQIQPPKKNTKISFNHREFFSRPATTRKCSSPRSWMQEICIKMRKRMRKELVPPLKSCRTQHCGYRIVRSPVTGYRVGPPSGKRIGRSSVNGGTGCRTGLNSDSRDVRSPGNSYWMMKRPPVWRTYGRNRICTYRIHVDNYVSSTKLIRKIGIF
jgi:hypothetical protein